MDSSDLSYIKQNIKRRYRSGPDNIGQELISPCLSKAKLYRRGTGFFSSGALLSYVDAIDRLITQQVKIQIICSPVIQDQILIQVLEANLTEEQRKKTILELSNDLVKDAACYRNEQGKSHLMGELLSYLIATETLEIKLAIPLDLEALRSTGSELASSHLYHVKMGYFKFDDDVIVAFDGSFNESNSGHQKHIEQAQVWRSWCPEDLERMNDVVSDIDADWMGLNSYIKTYELNPETIDYIKGIAPSQHPRKIELQGLRETKGKNLRDYQISALKAWKENNFQGILALATGTGKTKTAIAAIKDFINKKTNPLVLIAVPYIPLAQQWIEILSSLGINTISAFESQSRWARQFENLINSHLHSPQRIEKFPVMVCVNKTFEGDGFQNYLSRLDKNGENNRLIIVDECHHFNRSHRLKKLPLSFGYRMGLSATPYEPDEPQLLKSYFDKVVYEYSIAAAIKAGHLSEYEYHPICIEFTSEEAEEYIKTVKLMSKKVDSKEDFADSVLLEVQLDRILAGVTSKLTKLQNLLQQQGPSPHTLFYCGQGYFNINGEKVHQIETLTRTLYPLGWKIGRITSNELPSEREMTLLDFKNKNIHAIASMRVLDEGIDIPDCASAYILASQRQLRQSIQRRGRILRMSESKEVAHLYDFIITGPKLSVSELEALYSRELHRARTFSEDARNKANCYKILDQI